MKHKKSLFVLILTLSGCSPEMFETPPITLSDGTVCQLYLRNFNIWDHAVVKTSLHSDEECENIDL